MGLRAIVQRLGEVMSSGQQVSIDFEVGKLVCSDRQLRFAFVAELYHREGLDVPSSALQETAYRPSASFAPPSKDALSLSLQGNNQFGSSRTVKAIELGGWDDSGPPVVSLKDTRGGRDQALDEGAESEATEYPASMQSQLSRHERVHNEALGRHIAGMEREAASVVVEKEQWEEHLKRFLDEEQKDQEWRKALAKDYQESLKGQMLQAEERRTAGRQHYVEQASQHDFPSFVESPEIAVYDYIRLRRVNLKEDLDQQVDLKRRTKQMAKQRDREMDALNNEASIKEMALMKLEAAAKHESQRSTLVQAWETDKKIHSARKAIEEHHKAPASQNALSGILQSTFGGGGTSGDSRQGVQSLHLGASMMSPRMDGSDARNSPPSSRPITGSVRRMPIGAAASLALHKERLGSTGTRRNASRLTST